MKMHNRKALSIAAVAASLGASLGVAPVDAHAAVDMFLQGGTKDSLRESTQGKVESNQGKIESSQGKISTQSKISDQMKWPMIDK